MNEQKELEELQRKLKMLEDRAETRKKGGVVVGSVLEEEDQSVGHAESSSGGSMKRGWPEPGKPKDFRATPPAVRAPTPLEIVNPITEECLFPRPTSEMEEQQPPHPRSDEESECPQSTRRPSSSLLRQQLTDACDMPCEEHLHEYARLLGMDPTAYGDSLLLWIAAEGLSAPLPQDWCWEESQDGEVYYIHTPTRQTQWEHPVDVKYENLFRQHRARLQAVLFELTYLEELGWGLPLPMTNIHLTPGLLLDPDTVLWLHKSWSVEGVAYPGERTQIRVEELPIECFKELQTCTVTPAQPGVVRLSTVEHDSGAVVSKWLEVDEIEDGRLSFTFRENSDAPHSASAYFLQLAP
eukprot:TRINITY_DN3352_c3_g1_i1.p1 TRINITY_DN3352_c3_g1~~TRINITY_DN3352_c3_g1_i1.p1  ORF type:complete len:361 (+),score=50.86 TRINITY_DN3352_c3_g1_i1:26-1084(+)